MGTETYFSKPKDKVNQAYRQCLRCGDFFSSYGTQNRICKHCKDSAEWRAAEQETHSVTLRRSGAR